LSSVETRPLDIDLEKYRERLKSLAESMASLLETGNPIPFWLWIIIGGLLTAGGGIAIWQFWNATQPIVQSIQQWAPLMGGAFTMLMYVLAMIPFFFIFQIVMSLLRW
jgi:hypothetical protein